MNWDALLERWGPWALMAVGAAFAIWRIFLPMIAKSNSIIERALEAQREQARFCESRLQEVTKEAFSRTAEMTKLFDASLARRDEGYEKLAERVSVSFERLNDSLREIGRR